MSNNKPNKSSDYKEFYHIGDTIEKVEHILNKGVNSKKNLDHLLISLHEVIHTEGKYTVAIMQSKTDFQFLKEVGNAEIPFYPQDKNVLTLYAEQTPLFGLHYSVDGNAIQVNYVKKVEGIEKYLKTHEQEGFEPNPKGLVLAHFIARIGPILDQYPRTEVKFSEEGMKETSQKVWHRVMSRYFDSDTGILRYKSKRVVGLIGEKNNWISEQRTISNNSRK